MVIVVSQERIRMVDRRRGTGLMPDAMRGSRSRVRQTVISMLLEEVRILIRHVMLVRRVIRRRVRAMMDHMRATIPSLSGVRAVVLKELPRVLLRVSRPEVMLTTLNHLVIPRDPVTAVVMNRSRLKSAAQSTVMHRSRVNRLRPEIVPLMNYSTLVKRATLME